MGPVPEWRSSKDAYLTSPRGIPPLVDFTSSDFALARETPNPWVGGPTTFPMEAEMDTREALSRMPADYGIKVTRTITPEVLGAFRIVAA